MVLNTQWFPTPPDLVTRKGGRIGDGVLHSEGEPRTNRQPTDAALLGARLRCVGYSAIRNEVAQILGMQAAFCQNVSESGRSSAEFRPYSNNSGPGWSDSGQNPICADIDQLWPDADQIRLKSTRDRPNLVGQNRPKSVKCGQSQPSLACARPKRTRIARATHH